MFSLPDFMKIAPPCAIGKLAEHGLARAREGCEKIRFASALPRVGQESARNSSPRFV
jgi:hypothetical protein